MNWRLVTHPITLHAGEAGNVKWMDGETMSLQLLKQAQFLAKACHLLRDVNTNPLGFQTAPAALEAPRFICEEPFKRDATRRRVRRGGLYVAPQPRAALRLRRRLPLFHPAAARWKDFSFPLPRIIIPLTKSFSSSPPEDHPYCNRCSCRAAGMKYW